ncbi:5-formyltetrahydrofolate cyclo-ligase [Spirosoma fluviale]|uniref:5-formyltetrahydrofolate cyclo-ligase n=1 Tax=Spirosoma fluviale TaxID=1597977 RepID=A0A286GMQ8_9BACT|nr:5-formyltetrahydrofolate cyclo-ligase [Spirosoma fluviale]SOD96790.1 5-formyltetrahydrofolate cyclo-ligase [Spirosoma fluviale]
MTKAELRREFLAKRKALTADEVAYRSELIAARFFTYLEENDLADVPTIIHTFLPIKRHNEVNTWAIIEPIWQSFGHIHISVPVTDEYTHQLLNYTIFPGTPLVTNRLGIPEPAIGSRYETELNQISIVLVPLLAFDKQGNRVGYGGGYYDRFLAGCRPDCLKVGLSLFEAVHEITDIEPTDIKLDVCITPDYLHSFD